MLCVREIFSKRKKVKYFLDLVILRLLIIFVIVVLLVEVRFIFFGFRLKEGKGGGF